MLTVTESIERFFFRCNVAKSGRYQSRRRTFQLSEPPRPQGRETAIDFFLRSLAKDQGERSIGIVLSGTGSHGTLGIRDIKLAGGMAIAQQPTTVYVDVAVFGDHPLRCFDDWQQADLGQNRNHLAFVFWVQMRDQHERAICSVP